MMFGRCILERVCASHHVRSILQYDTTGKNFILSSYYNTCMRNGSESITENPNELEDRKEANNIRSNKGENAVKYICR